ncbi:MAG: anaerobic glycerol-3-phosphate dehydrogenase subunit A [Dysgonomonas sp.]|nr:anaerobic glycerol-3-phosphate dehydrogenase subunit A [Dysgonomonas sp.]
MVLSNFTKTFDVIIIGGGATGAGVARDCARRGLSTLLLERNDIATGATGRNHGLLHSGARYAVTDRESAEECIKENTILKRIASHCIEETDGLALTLPEDDISFQAMYAEACIAAGIKAEIIDTKEALLMEPSANRDIIGAVKIPDGSIDPFRLTASNVIDAKNHGAIVSTYKEVVNLITEQNRVIGVEVLDHKTKNIKKIYGSVVVNAAGIWGQHISEFASIKINMLPAKGALLIFGHRINNMVLNRCRKPADADILVPGDTISLIGTTSKNIPYDQIDNMVITPEEVDTLIREGRKLAPVLDETRILRAYAGVRPLVASDDDPTGRTVSRGIVLLDHAKRDGLDGYITITGGKLMTYRLMAEQTTDLVCNKLGISEKCTTADIQLPGSRKNTEEANKKMMSLPTRQQKSAIYRHGDMSENIKEDSRLDNSLVCECEDVTVAEVKYALEELNVKSLVDLRRRTRVGMGTCQGELCACRAAGIMGSENMFCTERAKEDLALFLNERWKGVYPIAWGDTLRESEYTSWVYESICGLKSSENPR